MRAGFFEAVEDFFDGLEAGVAVEQSLVLQPLGYFLDEVAAATAGIGKGGKDPDGRRMKGEDAEQLDAVAGSAFEEEIFSQPSFGGVDSLHLAHLFDKKTKGDIDHVAVQGSAPDGGRQSDISDLAEKAAGQCAERAEQAFGQREQVLITGPRRHVPQYSGLDAQAEKL